VVSSAVSLLTDPDQTVALAARHAVPALYAWRASMAVGGLMSYTTNLREAWWQAGVRTQYGQQEKKQRKSRPVMSRAAKFPTEEIPMKERNTITPASSKPDHIGGRPYRRVGELRSRAYSAACR
jgi:hypothetical protein